MSCMHLHFSFLKNSNLRTENGRDVYFTPKFGKYSVAFLVKKLRGIGGVVREIWWIYCKKMIEKFENVLKGSIDLEKI